jgi:hypothetical protein
LTLSPLSRRRFARRQPRHSRASPTGSTLCGLIQVLAAGRSAPQGSRLARAGHECIRCRARSACQGRGQGELTTARNINSGAARKGCPFCFVVSGLAGLHHSRKCQRRKAAGAQEAMSPFRWPRSPFREVCSRDLAAHRGIAAASGSLTRSMTDDRGSAGAEPPQENGEPAEKIRLFAEELGLDPVADAQEVLDLCRRYNQPPPRPFAIGNPVEWANRTGLKPPQDNDPPSQPFSLAARLQRTKEKDQRKQIAGYARLFRGAPEIATAALKKVRAAINSKASATVRQAKAKERQQHAKRLAQRARRENPEATQNDVAATSSQIGRIQLPRSAMSNCSSFCANGGLPENCRRVAELSTSH